MYAWKNTPLWFNHIVIVIVEYATGEHIAIQYYVTGATMTVAGWRRFFGACNQTVRTNSNSDHIVFLYANVVYNFVQAKHF